MVLYEHEVTAQPSATWRLFPIDMLRYDALAPKRETDSHSIRATFDVVGEFHPDGSSIVLTRWAERNWRPNYDRWLSMGWAVIGHTFMRN